MKLLTPEISWHGTDPVYTCDLQPFTAFSIGDGVSPILNAGPREPLSELPIVKEAYGCEDDEDNDESTCEGGNKPSTSAASSVKKGKTGGDENTKPLTSEETFGKTWTRLATGGGDKMVRLWRISLDWQPPSSVTVTKSKKPLPKGMLAPGATVAPPVESASAPAAATTAGTPATGNGKEAKEATIKVSAPVADGLKFLATLKRHERPVNIVRWSSSGKYLASGGDDTLIVLWHLQKEPESRSSASAPLDDEQEEVKNLENWVPLRTMRRHLEDICDICWSSDDSGFISGSVDVTAILWSLEGPDADSNGGGSVNVNKVGLLQGHHHYVQGVAWDPLGVYVATLSSDRTCRIYKAATGERVAVLNKAGKSHLFQDDSWKSFFRRLSFSPDGQLLICPAGNLESAPFAGDVAAVVASKSVTGSKSIAAKVDAVNADVSINASTHAPQHAAHIFLRNWSVPRPCVSLPTGARPVVAVRFCPQPFHLRLSNPKPGVAVNSLFQLPYRWVFCLVLDDGLLFFDTQQVHPFAQVREIHYQSLNDASWSSDGRLVTVTSTDGYCSLVHFTADELGTPYRGPLGPKEQADATPPTKAAEGAKQGPGENESCKSSEGKEASCPGAVMAETRKSQGEKHISFAAGVVTPLPRRPTSIPVTPNSGNFLKVPVSASPAPAKGDSRRRLSFITLSGHQQQAGCSKAEMETTKPPSNGEEGKKDRDDEGKVTMSMAESSEPRRRHISFQSGTIMTPQKPRVSIPVTPNTGRLLSHPVEASPMPASQPKRRVAFVTLSTEVDPPKKQEPPTTDAATPAQKMHEGANEKALQGGMKE